MNPRPLILDAHLDLAMNALEWNRDLTRPVAELRARELGKTDKPDRGRGTVSLPEMRRGGVGICVATLLARIQHNAYSPVFGWRSPAQAYAQTQGQLAWYRAMEEAGEMVQIRDAAGLEKQVGLWTAAVARPAHEPLSLTLSHPFVALEAQGHNGRKSSGKSQPGPRPQESEGRGLPIGCVLSLEGADSILSLDHLARAWEQGVRAIGPAHYGPGVYANGTDSEGGLNARGRELIKEMDRLGFILDVTHLNDQCFWEALDIFSGPVWASHQNCRVLAPHMRQFSDEQIKALIARGAVIGVALDAWMLVPSWVRGKTTPRSAGVTLDTVVNHMDHVCQLAGNERHIGIGSDLDGAFGCEQTPADLDTISDLATLSETLKRRGYQPEEIQGILHGNFINFLSRTLR